MNNISFQGNITVTKWKQATSNFESYATTKAQDKLIKHVLKDIGDEESTIIPLSKRKANFLFKLVEKFTGERIPVTENEKVLYKSGDSIVFTDKQPHLFDGARVEVDFD